MRVKTEAKRRAILDAARAVFSEHGFERASMSQIAERVGGSKATLYSYFPSKDDLFVAFIREAAAEEAAHATEDLESAPSLAEGLRRFGQWRLKTTLTPAGLSTRQMAWSDAGRDALTRLLGDMDERSSTWGRIAAQLEKAMDRGELRRADPWTCAQHFRGLLETDISDRAFFGFPSPATPALMRKAVEDAVDVFLRAYAPG